MSPPVDLEALRVHVTGKSAEELIDLGRRFYVRICEGAANGNVQTHDGHRVYVYPDRFNHAFYESKTRGGRGWEKHRISARRVERVRWIVPLIAGRVSSSECWQVPDYGANRRPPPVQRLYLYKPEPYVVWLRERDNDTYKFSSAFKCGWADVDRYTKETRGARKIWEP